MAALGLGNRERIFERAVVLAEGRYGETSKETTELRAELEAARQQR